MKQWLVLLTAFAFIFSACDEKKDPISPENVPTVPVITIKGPNTQSTDTKAQQIKYVAQTMNGLQGLFGYIQDFPPDQNGNTFTWVGGDDTYSETITATLNANGTFTWTVTLNGNDGSTTYNNFVYLRGIVGADGSFGEWTFYYENTTNISWVFEVNKAANGVVTASTLFYYSDGTLETKQEIVNNPDDSGEYRLYYTTGTTNVLRYKAIWAANGSGTWEEYATDGTTVTQSGNWN